jgi:hypothetical protein
VCTSPSPVATAVPGGVLTWRVAGPPEGSWAQPLGGSRDRDRRARPCQGSLLLSSSGLSGAERKTLSTKRRGPLRAVAEFRSPGAPVAEVSPRGHDDPTLTSPGTRRSRLAIRRACGT